MRLGHHLARAQEVFLRELRRSDKTLQDIRTEQNMDNPQITRWMRNRFFWDELKYAVKESRKLRRLEIEAAANVAARILAAVVPEDKAPLNPAKRKLLELAVDLGERLRQKKREQRRRRLRAKREQRKKRTRNEDGTIVQRVREDPQRTKLLEAMLEEEKRAHGSSRIVEK
jgi:hypothetical protein